MKLGMIGLGRMGGNMARRLMKGGHEVVAYDDLSRGHREAVEILGVPLVVADLADRRTLAAALREHRIETVMHFAAYAYVGESTESPLRYYENNVATTIGVLRCMREAGVGRFVFSSSCATYGNPERVPITEDAPQRPVSPYGHSKLMVEQVLRDTAAADPSFSFASLRYFNACGCAMDGSLGEHHDPEPHLIPSVLQAILGERPELVVFGNDYPTPDGTNVRDYVHVDDLARVDPDPELTDHLAIDLDATVGDQLLTHPPRADASGGQHLLQARALRVMDVDEGFARPLRGLGRL